MALKPSFWADKRGNIAVSMAIVIVPLMLAAGAAVDIGRANHIRTVLQGAADAAALAGGASKDKSDSMLQTIVKQYLMANGAGDVLPSIGKIEHVLDTGTGTFSVKISGKMETSFMKLAGLADMDLFAKSQVNIGSQALELALVLDNTGSMSGTKIANLKTAATNLINIIDADAGDYADVKMAVVPFAEYVNIGTGRLGESWVNPATLGGQPFTGCVGSRTAPRDQASGAVGESYPALANQPCNVEILPLTTNLSLVKSRIADMVSTGATYIPAGLLWGWNVLDANQPFTEGRTKASLASARGRKAIVLMTDGENTISASYPSHDGKDMVSANTTLSDLCSKVKTDGIEIYAVSFMVPSETIKDILVACATTPEKYFDAENSAQLNSAFAEIARDLSAIRLTN